MRQSILVAFCALNFAFLAGCSTGPKVYLSAPSVIPETGRTMKTAGFWISRHPQPDGVLMDARAIDRFNEKIREKKLIRDLSTIADPYSTNLGEELEKNLEDIRNKNYYLKDGRHPGSDFWERRLADLNTVVIPKEIPLRFGLTIHYAHQRVLPTDEILTQKRGDIDFDELQNSSLDVGTPLIILHESADGNWFFGVGTLSSGWVKKEDLALAPRTDWEKFLNPAKFVIVTRAKADLYLDPPLTQFYDYARMGTRLPANIGPGQETVQVALPGRDMNGNYVSQAGYVRTADVNPGPLAYTPRNVLEQAFQLLNEPYGWGGMYGEQDCSAFLDEIFAVFGIDLPRNSGEQAKVGRILEKFEEEVPEDHKREVLSQAIGGVTILPLKGHIVLYLGEMDGKPYAIHETWGYREPGERIRIINRVAVTSLALGEGSRKGSLLKRIKSVNVMVNE